jgi:hypothetical protein
MDRESRHPCRRWPKDIGVLNAGVLPYDAERRAEVRIPTDLFGDGAPEDEAQVQFLVHVGRLPDARKVAIQMKSQHGS